MNDNAAWPDPGRPRSVSGDLEEIFRSAPQGGGGRAGGRVRSIAAAGEGARERRPARIGALAATALVGLALGAAIARPGKLAPEAEAKLAAAPAPQQVARIDVPPVTPPPSVTAPAPQPVATAEPKAAAVADPEPRPTRRAAAKAERRETTRASSGRYPCNGLTRSAEARCAYPAVMAADRNLRAAYSRAVRAGVPRSTLVDYRSRWASLRYRADDQPAKVIYGYRAMARDLDRLSGART
ncbi:hypothetical protein ACO2Q0_10660 [Phenylobacterium sp. VNQ135]|uniref:hypothetical protein n=1 Tax=Phenylobacterium sp. VNQ135 TaxID=3400922 RepID=UPI003C05EEE0